MAAVVVICPDTKVGALLEAYPALEEVLISIAPAFEKLRNPMLRKTVAKVATLAQAARVGGIPVNELVRQLRAAVGQGGPGVLPLDEANGGDAARPAWVANGRVALDVDGDRMLEEGTHPVGRIRGAVAALGEGEVVRLTTSFRPEPLIDVMRSAGAEVYCEEAGAGRHVTWFGRRVD